MKIDGREISKFNSPYLIAEMSANHNGDIKNAINIIRLAKASGADAVKMQTYTPDTITLQCNTEEFMVRGGLWDGLSLYDLYSRAQTPWAWHEELFHYAKKIGITIFSSPFDTTAVDFLEDLNTPAYKIASFEAIDLPLIRYAASTKKPLIISTGMASMSEIEEAIDAAKSNGSGDVALLHCVSGYPAPERDYNLATIPDLFHKFGVKVGLSDHTISNIVAISSVALGAQIIEKHFTLDRNAGGSDDSFSIEPHEFKALRGQIDAAWQSIGKVSYEKKVSELGNVKFRRSLYFVRALKKGEVVTRESVKSIRPGYGLPPKEYEKIIGKKVTADVKIAQATSWDILE